MQDGAWAERSHQKEDGEEGWHIHQSAKENGEAYQAELEFLGSIQTRTQKGTKGLASQIIKQAAHLFLWHDACVQPLFGGGLCRPAAVVLTGLVCSGVLEVCARIATFGCVGEEKKGKKVG